MTDASLTPRPDPDAIDPGLASERTDLAWNRSALSLLGCGAVVVRGIATGEPVPGRVGVGVTILVLGAFTWAIGGWQARRRTRRGRARPVATRADLLPMALGTAGVGLAAFLLGSLFPG